MQVFSLLGIDLDIPVWLLITLGLMVTYYLYMTWKFDTFKKLNVKGPKPVPVLGNLVPFFKRSWDYDGDMIEEYGSPVGVFIGRQPSMVVSDPEILKCIFVKEFDHFTDRDSFKVENKPVNKSLTMVKGAEWKNIRNTLTPTFSSGKLKVMLQTTNRCADQLVENLVETADTDAAFEIVDYCGAFTMDVIARTGFGYELNTQKDPNNQFIVMAKKIMDAGLKNPFIFIMFFLPFLAGILSKLKLISIMPKDATNFFLEFTKQAFEQKLKGGKKGNVDFLQLMVNAHEDTGEDTQAGALKTEAKSKKKLTEDEILANGLIFFLAGYETTANTMALACYNLAVNQDVQDKLIAEIDEVVGNRDPSYDDLYKMPYIEQVISETLRMHPQAPAITRCVTKEITIKGIHFPKDLQIRIPVRYLHNSPDLYPNPEKFDPERFSPEQKAKRDPYVYLPFGLGPRMCIANRLALMELKIGFIRILQKFKLTTCEETQKPLKLQKLRVKPDGKLMLKVIKRS